MKCWICGNNATTKEHRIKQTIVSTEMKKNADQELQTFITKSAPPGTKKLVQSSKSNHLKYSEKNLCAHCNGARTQPFDFAFDRFHELYLRKENNIIKSKTMDLSCFTKTERQNLFRFFIKKLGCEINSISETNISIPKIFIDAMHGKEYDKSLSVYFTIQNLDDTQTLLLQSFGGCSNLHLEFYDADEASVVKIHRVALLEYYGNLNIIYHFCDADNDIKFSAFGIQHAWYGKSKKILLT